MVKIAACYSRVPLAPFYYPLRGLSGITVKTVKFAIPRRALLKETRRNTDEAGKMLLGLISLFAHNFAERYST